MAIAILLAVFCLNVYCPTANIFPGLHLGNVLISQGIILNYSLFWLLYNHLLFFADQFLNSPE